jgi:hypothetical protein
MAVSNKETPLLMLTTSSATGFVVARHPACASKIVVPRREKRLENYFVLDLVAGRPQNADDCY